MKVNGYEVETHSVWLTKNGEVTIILRTDLEFGDHVIEGLVAISSWSDKSDPARVNKFYWNGDGQDANCNGRWDLDRPVLGSDMKYLPFKKCLQPVPEVVNDPCPNCGNDDWDYIDGQPETADEPGCDDQRSCNQCVHVEYDW